MGEQAKYLLDEFRSWEQGTGRRQSVSNFARHLGVPQASLARWMRGDGVPDYENTAQLAKTLGINVYAVMGYEPPSPIIQALNDFQTAFNALPPDAQAELLARYNEILQDIYRKYGGKRIK